MPSVRSCFSVPPALLSSRSRPCHATMFVIAPASGLVARPADRARDLPTRITCVVPPMPNSSPHFPPTIFSLPPLLCRSVQDTPCSTRGVCFPRATMPTRPSPSRANAPRLAFPARTATSREFLNTKSEGLCPLAGRGHPRVPCAAGVTAELLGVYVTPSARACDLGGRTPSATRATTALDSRIMEGQRKRDQDDDRHREIGRPREPSSRQRSPIAARKEISSGRCVPLKERRRHHARGASHPRRSLFQCLVHAGSIRP